MDVNKNINKINNYLFEKKLSRQERFYVIKIAKVSKNIEELHENLLWDYKVLNIK
tara:strand:- start:7421 stop:7585 length:165 start_codon:yes stop_codon:yes gene_type:complete